MTFAGESGRIELEDDLDLINRRLKNATYNTLTETIETINENIKRLDNRVKVLEKERFVAQEQKESIKRKRGFRVVVIRGLGNAIR